ncbi:unnamed protein product, partial [Ectocarpus sp. 4 AP-2014]
MQCEWLVPWSAGVIEAIAYHNGVEVARTEQRTAAPPSRLTVASDTKQFAADGQGVSVVTVALADAAGTRYPYGDNRVHFHIEGPARLLSIENGNPIDTEPNYGVTSRRGFFGLTRAFLQATREVRSLSIVIGAILGERGQPTPDSTAGRLVAIDCQRTTLCGIPSENNFVVHYTLDGSPPTQANARYTKPFLVELGTTVRAAVFERGEHLFA